MFVVFKATKCTISALTTKAAVLFPKHLWRGAAGLRKSVRGFLDFFFWFFSVGKYFDAKKHILVTGAACAVGCRCVDPLVNSNTCVYLDNTVVASRFMDFHGIEVSGSSRPPQSNLAVSHACTC